MSVMAGLAQHPNRILRLFPIKEFTKEGLYCVVLCVSGVWIDIVVDDYLPCNSNGKPAFSRTKTDNVWPLVLEKAWAKTMNGYCSTASGTCMEGMHLLTGAPVKNFKMQGKAKEEIIKIIR